MKDVKNPIDLLNGKKNREVMEVGNLKITKNAIFFNGSVLQISNINHIYIEKFMKDPFPTWTIGGILIGLITLVIIIGIPILGFSIYTIVKYYKNNKIAQFGLHIQMSSKFCMIIGSTDNAFLENIQNVIADNFVENNNLPAVINLDNKKIIIEQNDGLVNTGEHSEIEFTSINE